MRSGRLARVCRTLVLAVAVASVGGCVSMQDSTPPGTLSVTPSDTAQNAANYGPIPVGPGLNWSAEDIVQGFLAASASFSTYPAIARAYLTAQADKQWNPQWSATVFSSFPAIAPVPSRPGSASHKQVTVTVTGQVQATLSGSGKYLWVTQGGDQGQAKAGRPCSAVQADSTTTCTFTLTQVAGQWRIAGLPSNLLLDQPDFSRVYQSQDLYFFNPDNTVLVPYTVFVPLGTSATTLLSTLVSTLISPGETWLTAGQAEPASSSPAHTSFPPGTEPIGSGVSITGGTATVSLGGAIAQAGSTVLNQTLAQLTWTLAGASVGLSPIQRVVMQIQAKGKSGAMTRTDYASVAPYPTASGVFTYLDNGVVQSRCGSVQADFTGTGIPVFDSNGGATLATCNANEPTPTASPTASATQKPPGKKVSASGSALSMASASPNGTYLAGVSADKNSVSVWALGPHGGSPLRWSDPGYTITSMSWDRADDLWLTVQNGAQNSQIFMLSTATGRAYPAQFGGESVTMMSIAPDGVRAALVVQTSSGTLVELVAVAVVRDSCPSTECPRSGGLVPTIVPGPPLDPSVSNAIALAWYDADDLIVVNQTAETSDLDLVPVNGRPAKQLNPPTVQGLPAGVYAESVAADSDGSVIAVGMSNGELMVSTGLNGTWQVVGQGSAPAYGVNP
jgi:hypothetical protein